MQSNFNKLTNDDLDRESFNEILESDVWNAAYSRFQQNVNKLTSNNGTISAFWMSYFDLTSLMLDFIRASKEKEWTLHLISISYILNHDLLEITKDIMDQTSEETINKDTQTSGTTKELCTV